MDKIKLIKSVDKLSFVLAITNFILWSGLFISLFLVDYNILHLKRMCVGATFIVVLDVFLGMLSNRDKKTKRKVMLEYMANEFKFDDKQGDK